MVRYPRCSKQKTLHAPLCGTPTVYFKLHVPLPRFIREVGIRDYQFDRVLNLAEVVCLDQSP